VVLAAALVAAGAEAVMSSLRAAEVW
jgi:hypothetical protein